MSDFFAVAMLILLGPGLLAYVFFMTRKDRWRDSAPALEVLIDRVAGVEVPERNRWDRAFTMIQLTAMSFVGLIMTGLGLYIILETLGLTE